MADYKAKARCPAKSRKAAFDGSDPTNAVWSNWAQDLPYTNLRPSQHLQPIPPHKRVG